MSFDQDKLWALWGAFQVWVEHAQCDREYCGLVLHLDGGVGVDNGIDHPGEHFLFETAQDAIEWMEIIECDCVLPDQSCAACRKAAREV